MTEQTIVDLLRIIWPFIILAVVAFVVIGGTIGYIIGGEIKYRYYSKSIKEKR